MSRARLPIKAKSRIRVTLAITAISMMGLASAGARTAAPAPVPTVTDGVTSDSAELCTSVDGRVRLVRGFGEKHAYFVVMTSTAPGAKPAVKENCTYEKAATGLTDKSAVTLDMFELMAEPFGGVAKDRTTWAAVYEEVYEGRITVFSDTGARVRELPMSCNSAIVEFR